MMAKPTPEEIHERLKNAFNDQIPRGTEIAKQAVNNAVQGHNSKWIKRNFSLLVERVQVNAYRRYLSAELTIGGEVLSRVFLQLAGKNAEPQQAMSLLARYFYSLDRFFLGLTQGRRPRAGKVFELLIRELFVRLEYPFSSQPIINGQPDFVLPSIDYFRANAPDCVILTIKRTLRERWRQIVTEGSRGLGFFLATIDEEIGAKDLGEMLSARIKLVVPTRIKNVRKEYVKAPNVITFENFFRNYLDPAMRRWKCDGII
jgi:hypothetical protein